MIPDGALLGGSYKVMGPLGSSALSQLYRARHVRTGQTVVLKLAAASAEPEVAVRLREEAAVLAALEHPAIVRVLDQDTSFYGHFVVLEHLAGLDLERHVATFGPLPLEAAAALVGQVASGLEAAHAASVVHRDIKPPNIVLHQTRGGVQAKIIDFGVARAANRPVDLTSAGALLGTPMFASPEQLSDPHSAGPAADIWALGLVLFHALTGRRFWMSEDLLPLVDEVLHQPIPAGTTRAHALGVPPGLWPPALDEALSRCLDRAPTARYHCATDLHRAVLDALAGKERADPSPRPWVSWLGVGSLAAAIAVRLMEF